MLVITYIEFKCSHFAALYWMSCSNFFIEKIALMCEHLDLLIEVFKEVVKIKIYIALS
jgi:hypothetical protein